MATVVYKNAVLLVDGASLATALTELTASLSAEMLDDTHFGDDTRVNKGGLLYCEVSGKGHAEFESGGIESVLFGDVGVDDVVVTVFPDGVVEGSTGDGAGYMMLGVASMLTLGEAAGGLLGIDFSFASRS